jgi:hypothetical protein
MKLFLDTANLDEIREGHRWGVLRGITTNPSLISKEEQDFLPLVKEICSIVEGDVSIEPASDDYRWRTLSTSINAGDTRSVSTTLPLHGLKENYEIKVTIDPDAKSADLTRSRVIGGAVFNLPTPELEVAAMHN